MIAVHCPIGAHLSGLPSAPSSARWWQSWVMALQRLFRQTSFAAMASHTRRRRTRVLCLPVETQRVEVSVTQCLPENALARHHVISTSANHLHAIRPTIDTSCRIRGCCSQQQYGPQTHTQEMSGRTRSSSQIPRTVGELVLLNVVMKQRIQLMTDQTISNPTMQKTELINEPLTQQLTSPNL
jgi:hypothetical protein